MALSRFGVTVVLAALAAASIGAQQPAVTVEDDDITIRGCISQVSTQTAAAPTMLVWSRSDIMMAAASAVGTQTTPIGTTGVTGRVFYWLDDDDLSKHVGQMVEIKGEFEDFEKGEIEIKRDGAFTEVKLDLDGKSETARVPTSWLGPSNPPGDEEQQFDIVARRIDVENVRVLGACNVQ